MYKSARGIVHTNSYIPRSGLYDAVTAVFLNTENRFIVLSGCNIVELSICGFFSTWKQKRCV